MDKPRFAHGVTVLVSHRVRCAVVSPRRIELSECRRVAAGTRGLYRSHHCLVSDHGVWGPAGIRAA